MDKQYVVYMPNVILFDHKKSEILLFMTTEMELETMLSGISQTSNNHYGMISVICGI
jgi:hypothetical protein